MEASREIFHSSKNHEWQTPSHIIEAARKAMVWIDLDPASSEKANERVKATSYFDREMDGLSLPWHGNIWLNPPYGRSGPWKSNAAVWSRKLIVEHEQGRVRQACLLVKAAPSEKWFKPLYRYPICFTDGRVSFLNASGRPISGNAHGSAIVGLGIDANDFAEAFRDIGTTVIAVN